MLMKEGRPDILSFLLIGGCLLLYGTFAYYLYRAEFIALILIYLSLFFFSWKIYQLHQAKHSILFWAGLLFRIALVGAIPNLSQDFYRFLWDGNLLLAGLNPFTTTPETFLNNGGSLPHAEVFYQGMGPLSAGNMSNYPPLNQLFFALAAWIGSSNLAWAIMSLRIPIILADLGIYFVGRRLLKRMHLSENRIYWYFLNPFIILELTGNLHFEGVMLFFLLLGIYLLYQKKWIWSALAVGLSIAVKLLPLVLLPLLFRYLKTRKALLFYFLSCGTFVVFFIPFFSDGFLNNYLSTIELWFQKFEFNGSFYYIIRWIGYHLKGYNIIQLAGPVLGIAVFLFVLFLSLQRRNAHFASLLSSMLFAISAYLFLATTVHPWYITTPLLLSIFTKYNYVYFWSLLVVLSYSAYSTTGFQENMWLISIEYGVVLGVLGYELYFEKPLLESAFNLNQEKP